MLPGHVPPIIHRILNFPQILKMGHKYQGKVEIIDVAFYVQFGSFLYRTTEIFEVHLGTFHNTSNIHKTK
jgi:hypothetical protein